MGHDQSIDRVREGSCKDITIELRRSYDSYR